MKLVIYVLAAVIALGTVSEAVAFSFLGDFWRDNYDTSCQTLKNATIDCTMCHPGGNTSELNPYSEDIQTAKEDPGFILWNEAVVYVETFDSDGDGVISSVEILTDCTLPGDPLSVPVGVSSWSNIKALYR